MEEVKKVTLDETHHSLGAKMIPFAGYNMPVRYSSDLEEHNTVRENVGVFDVSHMGEFIIEGPHALVGPQRGHMVEQEECDETEPGQGASVHRSSFLGA